MPKVIDKQARRERIAKTVWNVVARDGLSGATVRNVAAECGLSVGALQHSFPTQADLQRFAMKLIEERVSERLDALTNEAMGNDSASVLPLLLQLLPLDDEREVEARVWLAFFDASLTDPSLAPCAKRIDRLIGNFCRGCLEYLIDHATGGRAGEGRRTERIDDGATILHAALDGLTLHILANPSTRCRRQAETTVKRLLETLSETLCD